MPKEIKEYLPYIVSVLVAIISGLASYLAAARKCKADMKVLKESNIHEINCLMEQHKMDIDSLERQHKLEIEMMELKHKHQLELRSKEAENAMGSELLSTMVGAAMQTPEARQAIGQAFRGQGSGRKRRR